MTKYKYNAKTYSELSVTSIMERLCENRKQVIAVNYFCKKLIIDMRLGSKYVPVFLVLQFF